MILAANFNIGFRLCTSSGLSHVKLLLTDARLSLGPKRVARSDGKYKETVLFMLVLN